MVQKEISKRGRPRRYDPEAALDAVLEVFWRAGYSAASLEDICLATGMNKPSVYAAFGDKRALYLRAINRYREISREQMREVFTRAAPVREILRSAYAKALDLYYSGHDTPLGCFMVGAVVNDAVGDPEIRSALDEGLRQFDRAFARSIERAQEAGEISAEKDPETLGKLATAVLYYLSARSRAGESRATLEDFYARAVDIICGP
ncbi:MAG: TetR/AcrR family transcriptional regulator [Parvularculaceae bacterium]|nr:TetR/AcrR family transcriptional regulator [Parvularculaceae bacterium]